jgi:hypothetical protein
MASNEHESAGEAGEGPGPGEGPGAGESPGAGEGPGRAAGEGPGAGWGGSAGPGTGESAGAGGPDDRPGAMEDALSRLEQRLDQASEAAERLLADAARRVKSRPPPAGWQRPSPDGREGRGDAPSLLGADADLLLGIVSSLRDRIPPELQQRLAEALREVLLALRALIDWYLARTEQRRARPSEVQDIPIL